MKLSQLLNNIPLLEQTAPAEQEITGVSYDSRTTKAGELFVAICGYDTDGHKYIPSAAARGAAVVLCQEKPTVDIPYVLVEDSRKALAVLGANWYGHPAEQMTVIGVTGTNGKTTTTFLLKSVLEQCLNAKVGLVGTIQNMIGQTVVETEHTTPESFELHRLFRQMLDAGCTHVVMEVSSHALYLHRVYGIPFKLGVFTNLTQDHLDFHKTMESYCAAKAILFQNCEIGLFNLDDAYAERMMAAATCKKLTYSLGNSNADLAAQNLQMESDCVKFDAMIGEEILRFRLSIPGKFSVYNALCAIGAAHALGASMPQLAEALRQCRGVKGRVEVVPTPGKDYTVLIDYAHTPDALENVLRAVREFCKGRLIALFGCGGDRDAKKRPIMGKLGVELADLVVFTSDNPRTEEPEAILQQVVAGAQGTRTPYVVIENRREAIRWAMDHAGKDDIIVLAGKGHETYQILGKEKTHLDEREEVAAHLNGK